MGHLIPRRSNGDGDVGAGVKTLGALSVLAKALINFKEPLRASECSLCEIFRFFVRLLLEVFFIKILGFFLGGIRLLQKTPSRSLVCASRVGWCVCSVVWCVSATPNRVRSGVVFGLRPNRVEARFF